MAGLMDIGRNCKWGHGVDGGGGGGEGYSLSHA